MNNDHDNVLRLCREQRERIATLEEFVSRVKAGMTLSKLRTRDGWTQDAVKWLDSQQKASE